MSSNEPVIDLLYVIHEGTFHYICICQKVLELPPIYGVQGDTPKMLHKAGLWRTARDYVEVGTWMDCPACRTRYQITSIDYDDDSKQSGCMKAELGPTSGATNETGAKLRMLMWEDEDDA